MFHVISIHALVKRATVVINGSWRYPSNFNPRPREEGDLTAGEVPKEINISIHALVKRATSEALQIFFKLAISIHALVKRATYTATRSAEMSGNFNPRPREEGDQISLTVRPRQKISIHALVKRAT